MSALIRDAPIGQIVRWVTKNKILQYPEEKPDFSLPSTHAIFRDEAHPLPLVEPERPHTGETVTAPEPGTALELEPKRTHESSGDDDDDTIDLEKMKTAGTMRTSRTGLSRLGTRTAFSQSHTRADLEQKFSAATLERGPTLPIAPEKLDDGTILVDWYTTDDEENPQNWSFGKKAFVSLQIYLYTLAFYMGSSIYAPSELGVMERFGVSQQQAALGLSMYVLAYGIGPLIFSPLSEIPIVGRNPPYLITFAIFVVLIIPAAVVDNFAGLVVLRFLQGFFGSPSLATGGASLQDMFSLIKLPYALSLWALAATSGPALGPIISGFSVAAENWRWSLWEMLWLAGPIWILLFFALPETSPSNILLRRASRLRALTGNANLKSQSEIDQANLSPRAIVVEALWRPMQLMLFDPAIAFTAIYTALIYGIYYSFFEAFPLVYNGMYGFNLGQQGLTFLSITVGAIIAIVAYWAYIYYIVEPEIRTYGLGAPERRLIPALFVTFLLPIGLFLFGWTSNPSIHWIVSVIGIGIFTIGIFLILQCIFLYLPITYPQYAASLFAGNDFIRSTLAAGAIHFSSPLYENLGVGPGVSLVAGLTCGCVIGVYVLYFYGPQLRARSRFAAK